jgi:hypothetical protein
LSVDYLLGNGGRGNGGSGNTAFVKPCRDVTCNVSTRVSGFAIFLNE